MTAPSVESPLLDLAAARVADLDDSTLARVMGRLFDPAEQLDMPISAFSSAL